MEIIPGLPNDLSRECLLRVPCSSHYKLTSVCNSWENIVTNPRFYKNRKKFGASQELIILSVRVDNDFTIKLYDPLQKSLETLPPIPLRHTYFSDCVSVNHKLFVMGFLDREELLFVYDFLDGRWKRGPDLPNARRYFGCSVDSANGLIYIAGGQGSGCGAAVYNVEEEQWEYLPRMGWNFMTCHSAFVDGKLYVVEGNRDWAAVQCYDPDTRVWRPFTEFRYRLTCPPLPAFERLFFVGNGSVIEFDFVENQFHTVGTHYPHLYTVEGMTMWQSQIVICGKDEFCKLYLFEPGEEGREEKWTLLNRWFPEELGDLLKCCGTLTL